MEPILDHAFSALLHAPETIKILATSDEHGVPHLQQTDLLHVDADGRLVLLETDEYSRTQRNLVHSIWFNRKLTLYVKTAAAQQYQVLAKPYKAIITGPRFEQHYRELRERDASQGLSTVWLLDVEHLSDENPVARRAREQSGRLPFAHLDHIPWE
jgi:hypothetical protein